MLLPSGGQLRKNESAIFEKSSEFVASLNAVRKRPNEIGVGIHHQRDGGKIAARVELPKAVKKS